MPWMLVIEEEELVSETFNNLLWGEYFIAIEACTAGVVFATCSRYIA